MTHTLMLDVDGVLIDGRPEDGAAWSTELLADLGIRVEALHQRFFAPHWAQIVTGRKPMLPALAEALESLGAPCTAEAFVEYWFSRDSRIVTNVRDDCDRLRAEGHEVFLATNQEPLRARHLMETLGLAAHVDGIFASADLGARKPDPEYFAKVRAALGRPADNLLLIDDTRANVAAARQAGWKSALWRPGLGLHRLVRSFA